ncbi:MAG: hypothetical protein HQ526_10470 [Actinobacteria bacterium]|nr:hypothetical protein [Actinomycetota bacterium]
MPVLQIIVGSAVIIALLAALIFKVPLLPFGIPFGQLKGTKTWAKTEREAVAKPAAS